MTSDLFKHHEEDLLFVDIETVAGEETLDPESKLYQLWQWKQRKRDEYDSLPSKAETILSYKQKGALDAVYSKIVCISVGAISNGKIFVRSYYGEESDILRQFVDMVNESGKKTLVLWNAKFDMPTLRKRFFINKLKGYLKDSLGNDSMKKPWTLKGILDLMEVWQGISYYSSSLDEVAYVMGLPSPKHDLKGSEVSEAYYKGEIDRVVTYCEGDVITLINLWRIFTEREIITDVHHRDGTTPVKATGGDTVEVTQDEVVAKPSETPLIHRIFNRGTIVAEDYEILIQFAKGLKPVQRPQFVDLLSAVNHNKLDEKLSKAILKPPRKKRTVKKKKAEQTADAEQV